MWRNIIPHVSHLGRCIAPDLVGMGDSDSLPDSGPGRYAFINHRDYLFGLLQMLGESRRPTLTWPREVPLGGEPAVNEEIVRAYSQWLTGTSVPKLFVRANPGAIFAAPPMLAFARSLPNQEEVSVYGGHFVQEVSPDAIGRALAGWLARLG